MIDRWRRIIGVVSAIVFIAIAAWWANAAREQRHTEAPPPVETLAESFLKMAYAGDQQLHTWTYPVRILVVGDGAETLAPQFVQAAATFQRLTGVETRVVQSEAEGFNIVVQGATRDNYARIVAAMGGGGDGGKYLEEHLVCYALTLSRKDAPALVRAAIVIPNDLSAAVTEQCVWHELMHAFGFPGHPEDGVESVMVGAPTPTRNDVVLLRALYDARLVGKSPADAKVTLAAVIADISAASRSDPLLGHR